MVDQVLKIEAAFDRNPTGAAALAVPGAKILLTADELHELTGWGRGRIYELMAGDLLPVVRVGKRVRIHWPTLSKWFEEQASAFDGERLRNFLAA
jgi:excisionase family DNA binding protein